MTPGHEHLMRRCLELATIARSGGNTPVGSVVVLDGEIMGEAGEALPAGRSVTGHAEVLACQAALDRAGRVDLAGAALYTTAEPCFMCSYVIRQLRVALVVYGAETPLVGGVTSAHPILTDPTLVRWRPAPVVVGGVLRDDCQHLRVK
jgi:tRNA(adenine34) deaminase